MSKVMELREKRAKTWDAAKSFLDSKRGETGILSAEDTTVYERMEAEVVALGKEIERLDRQAALDAEMAAPVNSPIFDGLAGNDAKTGRASKEYSNAFWDFIRNKRTYEVRNALNIGSDPQGGYLVPNEFERQLIMALQEQNIMRQISTIINTMYGERKIPVVAAHGSASWVDEAEQIPFSDETFSQMTLNAFKAATMIKISNELLNDSVFDMPAYIASEFARRIGVLEEQAFLVGDGVGKPTGVTVGAIVGVTAAGAAAVTLDEMIDLYHSLRIPYRTRAVFIMHDTTVKIIRKIKDNVGQYLWQPSVQAGQPDRILNRPVYTSQFMPIPATGAKTILFGDFGYYWIADRQGRTFRRLDELYAETDQVGFKATQRVDGKLILPEAVKALQQAGAGV